ncbi:MAG: DUF1194 domain-containing protein [Pseudomonadota bacterium]
MRHAVLASLLTFVSPAAACEVALMLAVDVSGSVDPDEYRTQMDGLADALTDRSITGALVGGQSKLALMQWTGKGRQRVVISWSHMTDEDAVADFALQVRTEPRVWRNFSTAIGEAMTLALDYFTLVPECERRVIDISGDGPSNEGRVPQDVWEDLAAADVTVNALVIEDGLPGLTRYFQRDVITGPGAFAVTANGFEQYPQEIQRKLFRELTKAVSSLQD